MKKKEERSKKKKNKKQKTVDKREKEYPALQDKSWEEDMMEKLGVKYIPPPSSQPKTTRLY